MSHKNCLDLGKNWRVLLSGYTGLCSEAGQYVLSRFPEVDKDCSIAFSSIVAKIESGGICSNVLTGPTPPTMTAAELEQIEKIEKSTKCLNKIIECFMDSAVQKDFDDLFLGKAVYNGTSHSVNVDESLIRSFVTSPHNCFDHTDISLDCLEEYIHHSCATGVCIGYSTSGAII